MPQSKLAFDRDIRSYESFFDNNWKLEIGKVAKGTALDDAVVDLLVNWEAIANTHQMPHVLVQSLQGAWKISFSSESGAMGRIVSFADSLTSSLLDEMKSFSPAQKAQVRRIIKRIATNTKVAAQQSAQKDPDLWNGMTHDPQFKGLHLSLWGSQRLCYPALYFAFEVYVRILVSKVAKVPEKRIDKLADIKKAAIPVLTASVVDKAIDAKVDTARMVRNSLVHDGGRESQQLKNRNHGILVLSGTLQIRPTDTKNLYHDLKDRVLELTKAAIPHLP